MHEAFLSICTSQCKEVRCLCIYMHIQLYIRRELHAYRILKTMTPCMDYIGPDRHVEYEMDFIVWFYSLVPNHILDTSTSLCAYECTTYIYICTSLVIYTSTPICATDLHSLLGIDIFLMQRSETACLCQDHVYL